MLGVPDDFGDITVEWFQAALAEGAVADVDVDAITVTPLDPAKGLLGDLARIDARYRRGHGPESFVLKLPARNPGSHQVGLMLRAWSREVSFYRHVAPHSNGIRLPTCYYSGADEAAQRWAVVLEHLHADDFDFRVGASVGQAEAAVDAIADFHARWWDSPMTFDWMPGFDTTGVGGLQPLWLANLPAFLERYAHVVPDPTGDWVCTFAPQLHRWSASAASQPLTMVHSDYRIDNILFNGNEVTIIDWQTTMRAPAAMDLTCFLATSLTIEDRRSTEAALTERYLQRVAAAGVVLDREWFARSYDENLLWWMGQFGNNLAHLDPGDARVQAELDTMVERVYTAGLDHQLDGLL